jgi:hypothetical protein
MKSLHSFSPNRCLHATAAILLLASARVQASQTSELEAAAKESARNCETKEGQQYRDKFEQAIMSAFAKALHSCLSRPDTVEPAEVAFIISANGHVKKILVSPNIEYGKCVVSELRLPKTLPKPPRDLWPIAMGLANHSHAEKKRAGPPDKPISTKGEEGYDRDIEPYIAQARATYPAAKERFLAGLPPNHTFAVWIRLWQKDDQARRIAHEDVFVDVDSIKNGKVTGRIGNKIELLTNHHKGEIISFPESEVKNWLILRPDGTEEGNVVGKFLEHWKPHQSSNQSLQPTAGRRAASLHFMKTRPLQFALALARGG